MERDHRRIVERSPVERTVTDLEEAANGAINFGIYSRRRNHVETLTFYLDENQCARANAATDAAEAHREQTDGITMYQDRFELDPDMDGSYFAEGAALPMRRSSPKVHSLAPNPSPQDRAHTHDPANSARLDVAAAAGLRAAAPVRRRQRRSIEPSRRPTGPRT